MKKPVIAALSLLAAVAVVLLIASIEFINPDEQGVVYRFGKFDRILTPGIRLRWPGPVERVTVVSVYSLREMQGRWCCLAGSAPASGTEEPQVLYDVEWRVEDPRAFVEIGSRAEERIAAIIRKELASHLGTPLTAPEFSQKRTGFQSLIKKQLQKQLMESKTGIIVLRVALQTAHGNP